MLSLLVLAVLALGALAAVLKVAGWIVMTVGDWWRAVRG